MKRLTLWTKLFMGLVLFSIAGSLLSKLTGLDPGPIKPVASLLTILIGVIALSTSVRWWQCILVLAIGATSEIIGIYTGYPFGKYQYTQAWWPTIPLPSSQFFPLLLPFAWFLIAGGCAIALKPLGKPMLVLSPLMATLIDFFMEPVMTRTLGYWRWLEPGPLPGGAPWLNPIGWFATSFIAAFILKQGKGKSQSDDATWVLMSYVILMAALWAIGSTGSA